MPKLYPADFVGDKKLIIKGDSWGNEIAISYHSCITVSTILSKASSCKKLKNIIKSKSDNQLSTFVLTHSALKFLGIMGSLNINSILVFNSYLSPYLLIMDSLQIKL